MDKNSDLYREAKKRVKQLKGFYVHLLVYIVINGFFSLNVIIRQYFDGDTLGETLENFSFFSLWFFWGIGLFFHGMCVFKVNFLFSKDWEKRKIERIMEKDKQAADAFKS
ncbi:MAG: 2TM domain-containing protein [Flavobacteriia bacterium]|nr:2TM domain-containing protein [Flavobacteriia bacterium]